jgi:hypothetical protein
LGGARRRVLLVPAIALLLLLLAAGPASAATLNVYQSGCSYAQLAPALAGAQNGDTIKIGESSRRPRHNRVAS